MDNDISTKAERIAQAIVDHLEKQGDDYVDSTGGLEVVGLDGRFDMLAAVTAALKLEPLP